MAATDGDPDSRARLHYSVEPGLSTARTEQGRLPLSDWAGMFSVDPSSGEVVVSANLNSEAVEQLELQVVVEDLPAVGERLRSHSDLNIREEDVSNNSQVFMSTEYSGLVTENSPMGTNILSVLLQGRTRLLRSYLRAPGRGWRPPSEGGAMGQPSRRELQKPAPSKRPSLSMRRETTS